MLRNSNSNYTWAKTGKRKSEVWRFLPWEELGCFSMVEHQMVNCTHETVRAGWKSAISVCKPCSETQWLGLHGNAWKCDQATCRVKLLVCHQHRKMCMHCLHRSCQPKAAACWACLGIPALLHWHVWLCCVLGGVTASLQPGWLSVSWRINQTSSLLHFQCCHKWGASIFPFLLLEENMSVLMLRCSQPVVQNRWNYKSLLSRTKKGKRQKEASAGECQAQWGLGKFPTSFLQFLKSLVDFSTTHSLYLINNT